MSDGATANPRTDWAAIIMSTDPAATVWATIFDRLRDLALACSTPANLHRPTIEPDRLLAEAAWNLWQEFPTTAPKVVKELRSFWESSTASGTAVLILDALSLRELPIIVTAAQRRGITPTQVQVRACEVPTDTDRFAEALGLPGRVKLANNRPPGTFLFGGSDTATDVLDSPFQDCVGSVPVTPRVFIWHKWPDEPLIHGQATNGDGPATVARETKEQLTGDGFWQFVDRLRKGRRLVITSDHGYAVSQFFSSEVKDEVSVRALRMQFRAQRFARENPDSPWSSGRLPPVVCRHNGSLVVMGQRKWTVQGGFPNLCHGGLSLLEAAVPYIELPPT